MERVGIRNEIYMYCLHTVYFLLMKKSVEIHRESWNLHKLRILRYKSHNLVFKSVRENLKAHSLKYN